jgi:hypothetical protein
MTDMTTDTPKLKQFIIPVSWTMTADMVIFASTYEDACAEAEDGNLPEDGGYVHGSFEINHDLADDLNSNV